ncbi:carbohydrate ABC transporter permease [Clostridium beijerinckii]|uniref:Aldouronate transport system permease protein n=1 Tax=Clostridium beijerinckii TaxID=1520 RepID=A0A1S8PYU5_CLOBE|nr:carbohydrate ABC transporter permease [Clostridium beijerinckii]MCI1477074.1 carbohydrate ABC transporter permease [Clostridium beijerinckii]MCI1577553.1 carbohydrate ABC transporter permease [Clostridium beijerinckii]MCI1583613.1 carbohydrate ABC transporter permease [Clostridium beijerinckii]MCI1621226.1 carbohydrate ABC transporter permease [Clostridium beijerinckii]NMF05867.1 carbohydrate ABC transporter permease [Clostridium beijerinckii]
MAGLKKRSKSDIIFDSIIGIFMVAFVIVTLYPILNTLAISFNDGIDTVRGGIYLWPREFTMKNYQTVFNNDNLVKGAFISVSRTIIGTVLHVFLTAMLAYIISRKDFIFKKQLSIFYVITMYVSGGMIPVYVLMKNLHLTNNFLVYILPGLLSAFNMIVIRTFINGLPDSLVESAKIDGAGEFRIFIQIVLPLCKPVLATVALFVAVDQWNAWFDAMLYNSQNINLTTLQYELMKLLSSAMQQGGAGAIDAAKNAGSMVTPKSIRAAATIITALPIVCLYPFLQRYFVSGLTIGGVKE